MNLPQELLDKIIDYLPFYPWEHIRNCSLVAKSWVRPCQRRLFEFVWIYERNLRSWLDNISPTNVELLGHVRLLSYNVSNVTPRGEVIEPERRLDYLRNFLPSFRQLRSLIWFSAPIPWLPRQIEIFSAFQHTLSYLCLWNSNVTTNALVVLLNYFPNLTSLGLNNLSYHITHEPILPLSRPSLERLEVTKPDDGKMDDLGLFDELSQLGLQLGEVHVSHRGAKHVLAAFGASAQRLTLLSARRRVYNPPEFCPMDPRMTRHNSFTDVDGPLTLSHCRELRELEIRVWHLGTVELNLISSITSMNIQKISLTSSLGFEGFSADHTYWTQLDNSLCQLANKSRRKLEMVFGEVEAGARDTKPDFQKYIPRFIEKGRVRVVDKAGKTIVYCSDE